MSGEPEPLAARKAAARLAAHERRQAAAAVTDPLPAQAALLAALAPFRGRALAGYIPIRSEIDPRPAMAAWAMHSPVCLPVIAGPGLPLRFHLWRPETALAAGRYGVPVPAEGAEVVPGVLVVPMLAFDGRGHRLGYGGGYYDRTLQALRQAGPVVAIGFAFAAQAEPDLPSEPNDQRLDAVVTEAGALWFDAAGAGEKGLPVSGAPPTQET